MKLNTNFFLAFVLLFIFYNCKNEEQQESIALFTDPVKEINALTVNKKELVLNQNQGVWYYNDIPFNGYSEKINAAGTTIERLGFYNGKREGVAETWSNNGNLRIQSYYKQNKLTGLYESWWENGTLSLQVNYVKGKKEGEERQWFSTGELSKVRQLKEGRENGIQKAWLINGKLYVNYEAKNGRIFGMKRANSCYKLEDEKLVTK
ncbi:toxin-antitoxin system YwqK family antitoxin [Lacinutrix undariae]